ncbi:MAG: hypothetical protein KC636_05445, partial [Myxococcales bacterium]|nr:hypothetical protein [Myxococcales bacterium]
DYIFRELAVTYLARDELAHVSPEDLQPDSLGTDERLERGVDYAEEEVVSERVVTPGPLKLSVDVPRSGHLMFSRGPRGSIEVEDRTSATAEKPVSAAQKAQASVHEQVR